MHNKMKMMAKTEPRSSYAVEYLSLLVITLAAIALRFYKLGTWSFWGDEMFTLRAAETAFDNGPLNTSLTFIFTSVFINWFGVSEWSARLFPALVGALSVPLFYFPFRRMFNRNVALIAVALLAFSTWHIYWSQNARFYTPMLVFYTFGLLAFYFGIEEDRPAYILFAMLMMGLTAYERLTGLLIVPVLVAYLGLLYLLPFGRPPGLRLRNLALFFSPGLLVVVVLVWELIQRPERWMEIFGWVNNNPLWLLAGIVYYLNVPLVCMAAVGGLLLLTQKSRAGLLLTLGAVIPILAIMALSLIQYAANRYAFVTLTSWVLLAAVAVNELLALAQGRQRLVAAGVLVLLLAVPLSENLLYYRYQNGNRDNWKGALALVAQQKQEHDVVYTAHALVGNYYLQEPTHALETLDVGEVAQLHQRTWFVEDMNVEEKWPDLHRWIEQHAEFVDNFDVHVQARNFKMRVYRYDPPLPSASPTGQ